MGYRSDVSLSISKEVLTPAMILLADDLPELIRDAIQHKYGYTFHAEDEYYSFYWEGLKWYDGYSDVDAVTNLYETIEDDSLYHFLRLGEEADDNIDEGGLEDELYIRRSIEMY